MIEPSDSERASLPPATLDYIDALEERVAVLESIARDFLELERWHAPDMSGKRPEWAYIRPGAGLAAALERARVVLGYDKGPTDPAHGGKTG